MNRMVALRRCDTLFVDPVEHEVQAGARRLRNSKSKHAIDVLGAGVGLIILLPFFLLVALLIKLSCPGPVFFKQLRTGRDGIIFSIYKFRTMRSSPHSADVIPAQKNDRRCTMLGRFLRRSSIDELPQLINVLRGEMSLVGPRPHAVEHDNYYGSLIDGYTLRFGAVPGITGLAQSLGHRGSIHNVKEMADRVALDLQYVSDWSLALDVKILVRTALVVLFQRTAY